MQNSQVCSTDINKRSQSENKSGFYAPTFIKKAVETVNFLYKAREKPNNKYLRIYQRLYTKRLPTISFLLNVASALMENEIRDLSNIH